jgi:hypothetical protein
VPDYPIYRGFGLKGALGRLVKSSLNDIGRSRQARELMTLAETVMEGLRARRLQNEAGLRDLAASIAEQALDAVLRPGTETTATRVFVPLRNIISDLIEYERLFVLPDLSEARLSTSSALWEAEDRLRALRLRLDHLEEVREGLASLIGHLIGPIIEVVPALIEPQGQTGDIGFETPLLDNLSSLPDLVEGMVQLPFAPDFEPYSLTNALRSRIEYNLIVTSGGMPGGEEKPIRLPTRATSMTEKQLVAAYLGGTPLADFFSIPLPIVIPTEARFEHHHIVAGSGHGKTQTLQQLILHDLGAVAEGRASVVVIDSQSDLINNIAGLAVFAEGGELNDRLCLIDPTDVEWPVALNLFDVGQARFGGYSALDRERLLNGILELYDFVLGSLLDAGMTQKQTVIFRYLTRLLLQIPDATIHTFRELLEDDGYDRYAAYIRKLEGSARSFFDNEFRGKQFAETRRQVLRRLYGILENQTFERMFSHPKSKLDLFSEMNAGKVILINTAKDLLKENGTEIFGRFFIAMIAQAAQERAVLARGSRMPTFVYVDEASDYFDRNIGIILSQARKNRVGMVLSHQYLGQLDPKLHEATAANTAIKFAGGVSAKDARALAGDLRADPAMIEGQERLSFAAYIKGQTKRAVSIKVEAGQMEREPRMTKAERQRLRESMRQKYAVHYTEARVRSGVEDEPETTQPDVDTGEPMKWE